MFLFFAFCFVSGVFGAPKEDLITSLPGLTNPVNFKQYSGYLDASKTRHIHYWFVESQNKPSTDPLILWLSGGPGCSSLEALMTENGPFKSKDGKTLIDNKFSWNKVGNVLYLEAPTCVGFSYKDGGECDGTDDARVARENLNALKNFFKKFPEYRKNNFYVTGESYGGIYVPTLSVDIIEDNDAENKINLKGYAIGNGVMNWESNQNSLFFFGRYHAIIGTEKWNALVKHCCDGVESREKCDFNNYVSYMCKRAVLNAQYVLMGSGLNIYNIYADCESAGDNPSTKYTYDYERLFMTSLSSPNVHSKKSLLKVDPPCLDSTNESTYLNRDDVRTALHIPKFVQEWDICSEAVNKQYHQGVQDVTPYLEKLKAAKVSGLVYSGDVDMAVNFLGSQWFVHDLGWEVTDKRRNWIVNNQVGGFQTRFEGIDLVTVRGSGHMVPKDKPQASLHVINVFVNGGQY